MRAAVVVVVVQVLDNGPRTGLPAEVNIVFIARIHKFRVGTIPDIHHCVGGVTGGQRIQRALDRAEVTTTITGDYNIVRIGRAVRFRGEDPGVRAGNTGEKRTVGFREGARIHRDVVRLVGTQDIQARVDGDRVARNDN